MNSCEDIVGLNLETAITNNSMWKLIAYHAPSAKSYSYDHFPFPMLREDGKKDGKRRYHFDIIAVSENTLLFIELKCRSSESLQDITKLDRFIRTYSIEQIKRFIKTRLTTLDPSVLDTPKEVVVALGVMHADALVPHHCGVISVENGIKWKQIPAVSFEMQQELRHFETI